MTDVIQAGRLNLITMTPDFLRASLAGSIREAEELIGLALPADWPDGHTDILSMRLKDLEDDPAYLPWSLRAMALRDTCLIVGRIGFHSLPGAEYLRPFSPSGAEFGYTVFPAFRRRGYAREASLALMDWARQEHGVTKFVLSIRPDNAPSQALAAQLGFVRIGPHMDEVDGLEDVLEYCVPRSWAQHVKPDTDTISLSLVTSIEEPQSD